MYSPLGDDIIFSGANSTFTLATGERRCFNVTIVDDDEIEYNEYFGIWVEAVNTSLTCYYFNDYTRIIVRDNEGQLHLHHWRAGASQPSRSAGTIYPGAFSIRALHLPSCSIRARAAPSYRRSFYPGAAPTVMF